MMKRSYDLTEFDERRKYFLKILREYTIGMDHACRIDFFEDWVKVDVAILEGGNRDGDRYVVFNSVFLWSRKRWYEYKKNAN